jgi:2-polyprenyl-6-methoxyphenol hydroxylase-like FAD-dependent oxidoreductase
MVDPISVAIGIGAAVAGLLAAGGLYLAGRRPAHVIDMREVSAYYRHVSANEALQQDIDDPEANE